MTTHTQDNYNNTHGQPTTTQLKTSNNTQETNYVGKKIIFIRFMFTINPEYSSLYEYNN